MQWLRYSVHPTWHLTTGFFGVVAGVVLSLWCDYLGGFWWASLGVGLLVMAMAGRYRYLLAVALVGGMVIGLARGGWSQQQLAVYEGMVGKHVQLTGSILTDPQTDKAGRIVVEVGHLSSTHRVLAGEVRVTITSPTQPLRRSDVITVDGLLEEGFGRYAATMTGSLIHATREQGADPALGVRDLFSAHIKQIVHEPAASLGIGYLLGQKQALPDNLQSALQVVGLTHIVVASGYNLTILVRLARRSLDKVSRYLAAVAGAGLVIGFISMTGLSPSITRAGIVTLLSLVAWYVGRQFHPVTLLGLVAAATVIWDPTYAWGDIGWLLSFAAFAGVMILAPLLTAYFYGDKKPSFIAQVLLETSSAQLMTAPIIIATFGTFSNIALIANIIIVPLIPATMLLVFIAGVAAWLPSVIATIVAWPAQVILDMTVGIVYWLADLPGAQSRVQLSWWEFVLWYGVLLAGWWYMRQRTAYRLRHASVVE